MMRTTVAKQMKSTKSVEGGGDEPEHIDLSGTMHGVMMSPELEGVLDPTNLYGDVGGVDSDVQDDARDIVSVPGFTCNVTLSDDEVRSASVLMLSVTRRRYEVRFVCTPRVADDVCTGDVIKLSVDSPSGVNVFEAALNDEDVLDVGLNLIGAAPVVTLGLDVEDDT